MEDKEILRRMKLSEAQLRTLLSEFDNFVKKLDSAQRAAFLTGLVTAEEAADELDDDASAAQLEAFMRKHAPANGPLCYCCTPGGHRPPPPPRRKHHPPHAER